MAQSPDQPRPRTKGSLEGERRGTARRAHRVAGWQRDKSAFCSAAVQSHRPWPPGKSTSWLSWPAVFWPHSRDCLTSWGNGFLGWPKASCSATASRSDGLGLRAPLRHRHLCSLFIHKRPFLAWVAQNVFFLWMAQGSPLSPGVQDVEFSEGWIFHLPGVCLGTASQPHPTAGSFLFGQPVASGRAAGIASRFLPSLDTPQPSAFPPWPRAGFVKPHVALGQKH